MSGRDEMPECVKRMRESSFKEKEIERRIAEQIRINMSAVWYIYTPRDPNLAGLLRNEEENVSWKLG